jgi:tetratricopeptide (TPR) repeat protein
MPETLAEFMRYSAPDMDALHREIDLMQGKLHESLRAGDSLATLDHVSDLGSMLTTARREADAVRLLQEHSALAEAHPQLEPAGWYWNALATALQYTGQREQADACFRKAVEISRAAGWSRLLAVALHHWGRCLAERRQFAEAEQRIQEALDIRVQLGDPRQDSSRRALEALAELRSKAQAGDGAVSPVGRPDPLR